MGIEPMQIALRDLKPLALTTRPHYPLNCIRTISLSNNYIILLIIILQYLLIINYYTVTYIILIELITKTINLINFDLYDSCGVF